MPQNTPSDMALPIRGKKNSALPTRAQASIPPTRRPAQAPGPASLIRGQTAEAKGTATLQSRLDKMAGKYVAGKGAR